MSTHIGAKAGDIAEGILLPGDPMRAKYIAETFLEDPVCFNKVRGMYGFTGKYNGKRISVMGTGMGIPSISIYINELMKDFGVKYLCRVGTCGALQPELGLQDVVIAKGACTDSDFNRTVFNGNYCPAADFMMLRTAYKKCGELGLNARVGNILSSDLFYREDSSTASDIWAKYNVLACEMEAAALYTYAKKYNCHGLAMATVSDSKYAEHQLTPEERQTSLNNMIKLALETVSEFLA